MRQDSKARTPREISSRSANESRNKARGLLRTLTTPAPPSKRWIDFVEHPTAAAARAYVSPPRIRRRKSARSASVSRRPCRIPDLLRTNWVLTQFAGSVAMTA